MFRSVNKAVYTADSRRQVGRSGNPQKVTFDAYGSSVEEPSGHLLYSSVWGLVLKASGLSVLLLDGSGRSFAGVHRAFTLCQRRERCCFFAPLASTLIVKISIYFKKYVSIHACRSYISTKKILYRA